MVYLSHMFSVDGKVSISKYFLWNIKGIDINNTLVGGYQLHPTFALSNYSFGNAAKYSELVKSDQIFFDWFFAKNLSSQSTIAENWPVIMVLQNCTLQNTSNILVNYVVPYLTQGLLYGGKPPYVVHISSKVYGEQGKSHWSIGIHQNGKMSHPLQVFNHIEILYMQFG